MKQTVDLLKIYRPFVEMEHSGLEPPPYCKQSATAWNRDGICFPNATTLTTLDGSRTHGELVSAFAFCINTNH